MPFQSPSRAVKEWKATRLPSGDSEAAKLPRSEFEFRVRGFAMLALVRVYQRFSDSVGVPSEVPLRSDFEENITITPSVRADGKS